MENNRQAIESSQGELQAKRTGVALIHNNVEIVFDDDRLVCLTNMWRAAHSPANKAPKDWVATDQGRGFVQHLMLNLNVVRNHIWKSRRGKHLGGTWAHWQIALAYAKYLSHEFHRLVNEAFREWSEECRDPDLKADRAIAGYRRQGRDDVWIETRVVGKLARAAFTRCLQEHHVCGPGYAICTDEINVKVLGESARRLKAQRGLPTSVATRDNLKVSEIAGIRFAELLAAEQIQERQATGNRQCAAVCSQAGEAVYRAAESMRTGGPR